VRVVRNCSDIDEFEEKIEEKEISKGKKGICCFTKKVVKVM
jgi:hypothetical protein